MQDSQGIGGTPPPTNETTTQREQSDKATPLDDNEDNPKRDFEGGFGGLEELEDRYATTSGEH
jgi:hypothetical protein